MKKKIDLQKGAEVFADMKQKTTVAVKKTAEVSKQVATNVAGNVQKGALSISEKTK